jgi:hypothetical protein
VLKINKEKYVEGSNHGLFKVLFQQLLERFWKNHKRKAVYVLKYTET